MKRQQTKHVLTLLLVIAALFCTAQEKRLTLEDAVWLNPEIRPQRLQNLQWMGESDYFVYTQNNELLKCTPHKESKDVLLHKTDLDNALSALSSTPLRGFPNIRFTDKENFTFVHQHTLFQYNIPNKQLQSVNNYPENAGNIDMHQGTFSIAYTIDNNLYINKEKQSFTVSNDENKGIVNGQAAHRSEFGISKGTFWSPKGNKLAFYRMDETMVTEYPLVNASKRIATAEPVRYPMAGMTSHQVQVGLYDIATGKTIFLKQQPGAEAEQYWTNISWSPDEKYLLVAIVNRDQNKMELCRFDAATGDYLNTIFTETNSRYVEPMYGAYFLSNSATEFLWQSRKDGFRHIYLSDINGSQLKQITTGNWEVAEISAIDLKGENVFFTAAKDHPLENNIYSCNIKSGKITRISPDHGTHYPIVNKAGTLILDVFNNTEVPYAVKAENNKGKSLRTVFESPNPLKNHALGEMTIDKIKSDNGVDLYYRLIKPVGFDPNKKYPTIIYVYGGPHSQMVTDSWLGGNDIFLFYLAQEGYVVFTLDNQGTNNRGFEFESIIHRQVGTQEVKDQMAGLRFLKQFPWVDQNRIGVDGWSYGGFMTINMLLTYPGTFKAGCAGGPVCDWKYYEIMYGERYMDTPEQNPDGYKNSSVIERAGALEDRLLIIHGDMDPTVVWQNSLDFVKKCVDEGILLDYFVYPGHEHNVRGKDRVHLYKKIVSFFDEQLK